MHFLILSVVFAASLFPDGVIFPAEADGFGEGAQLVTGRGIEQLAGGPEQQFAQFVGQQLPASDREKWYLTAYVDRLNDPESRLLLQDLDRHPGLAALKGWCKFQMVDRLASPSAEARYLAQELTQRKRDVPTLMLYANPDDPVFGRSAAGGWRYVYDASGYGGDAEALARNLYESIRREYQARGVPAGQCPGPYCPNPNLPNNDPYQPQPSPPPYQPNSPYQPQRPDDWKPTPPPRPMDDPGPGPATPAVPWQYLAAGAALLLFFWAQRRGLLDPPARSGPSAAKPPGPPAAAMLLLALSLAAAVVGCRQSPCCPAAEVGHQAVGLAVAQRAPMPAAPIVDDPADSANGPCELAIIDRARAEIEGLIQTIRTVVLILIGLGTANLAIGLRLLSLARDPRS
jgi:hypothetical protein